MERINTDELNPIDVYYRIEHGSAAEKAFDEFVAEIRQTQEKQIELVEKLKPCEEARGLYRGGHVVGFAIPQEATIPTGWRKAKSRSRETSEFEGMPVIYPALKNKAGITISKELRAIPDLPESIKLVEALGFGYEGFLIIGNRLYRNLGYFRKEGGKAHIAAKAFCDKTGKFYHGTTGKLVDALPLVEGLVEIKPTEYFAASGGEA